MLRIFTKDSIFAPDQNPRNYPGTIAGTLEINEPNIIEIKRMSGGMKKRMSGGMKKGMRRRDLHVQRRGRSTPAGDGVVAVATPGHRRAHTDVAGCGASG